MENKMKTAEELFAEFHTRTSYGLIFYEQNFIEALTEHDKEIISMIDEMIEVCRDNTASISLGRAQALTELKTKIGV